MWRLKDPTVNRNIYNCLKEKGYYDLTIQRMIKTIADKKGAHMEAVHLTWIEAANQSQNWKLTAISCFATQMIYAATKQIRELKGYLDTVPMIEIER